MSGFFHEILYRPLFNILAFLYNNLAGEDLGIAIVLLALIVRLVLFPIFQKSFKSSQEMQKIQPEVQEIKEKYKNDRQKMTEKQIELFQERGINPFAAFLPLLSLLVIQLPVILMINRITRNAYSPDTFPEPYSWVDFPASFNEVAFGFLNLNTNGGNVWISLLLAIAIFVNFRMSSQQMSANKPQSKSGEEPSMAEAFQISMQQMKYVFPIVMFITSYYILPLPLSLYILPTITFLFIQQYITRRMYGQNSEDQSS